MNESRLVEVGENDRTELYFTFWRVGEVERLKKGKGRRGKEEGRKETEPCSHYASWETSRCSRRSSHNSRSWHSKYATIWSKFAPPGWHTQVRGEAVTMSKKRGDGRVNKRR